MVGAPGVGKTSLVRRFVHSVFSDEYRSTLGVKVDRKTIEIGETSVSMVLWDMHGEAEGLAVPDSYLRGAGATLAVFDAGNPASTEQAGTMLARVRSVSPNTFGLAVANKSDLDPDWVQVDQAAQLIGAADVHRTSAKNGDGVEDVFVAVANAMRDRAR